MRPQKVPEGKHGSLTISNDTSKYEPREYGFHASDSMTGFRDDNDDMCGVRYVHLEESGGRAAVV
jgi:hypothetical protein